MKIISYTDLEVEHYDSCSVSYLPLKVGDRIVFLIHQSDEDCWEIEDKGIVSNLEILSPNDLSKEFIEKLRSENFFKYQARCLSSILNHTDIFKKAPYLQNNFKNEFMDSEIFEKIMAEECKRLLSKKIENTKNTKLLKI